MIFFCVVVSCENYIFLSDLDSKVELPDVSDVPLDSVSVEIESLKDLDARCLFFVFFFEREETL